jgi:hypothetical protein
MQPPVVDAVETTCVDTAPGQKKIFKKVLQNP